MSAVCQAFLLVPLLAASLLATYAFRNPIIEEEDEKEQVKDPGKEEKEDEDGKDLTEPEEIQAEYQAYPDTEAEEEQAEADAGVDAEMDTPESAAEPEPEPEPEPDPESRPPSRPVSVYVDDSDNPFTPSRIPSINRRNRDKAYFLPDCTPTCKMAIILHKRRLDDLRRQLGQARQVSDDLEESVHQLCLRMVILEKHLLDRRLEPREYWDHAYVREMEASLHQQRMREQFDEMRRLEVVEAELVGDKGLEVRAARFDSGWRGHPTHEYEENANDADDEEELEERGRRRELPRGIRAYEEKVIPTVDEVLCGAVQALLPPEDMMTGSKFGEENVEGSSGSGELID